MASPCNTGFKAVRVSTNTRARASKRSGNMKIATHVNRATPHITTMAMRWKRHMPRSMEIRFSSACFMSEPRLRDDQHVTRLQRHVLFHVAVVQQVGELQLDFDLLAVDRADQLAAITGGKLPEAAGSQNGI